MGFNAQDLLNLKAELANNPLALTPGYLSHIGANDEANANALNLVRAETKVDRESVPLSEVVTAVDADEFVALSQPQRDYLIFITNGETVNPKSGNEIREALLQFFSAQSETRSKLLALVQENSSRVVMLYKAGTLSVGDFVTPSDVSNARNAV